MTKRDDYAKQLLADFIVARLKAKQAAASGPEPPVERAAPAASERHHETPLPCRAKYPLFGLGSSN